LLAAAAQAAARGGRPDLEDRFAFSYRRSLAPRPGMWLAELVALVARRVR
jgi:hypothetical protein